MDWQRRYEQQAQWTASVRQYLAGRAGLASAQRVLEVGCGTGAITRSLHPLTKAKVFGLDFNFPYIQAARQYDPATRFCDGDARQLPFRSASFDAVVCHFFLLWVPEADRALEEMLRVARPGAAVIAFAEPDYGGRIDYPPPLEILGELQAAALRDQGAETNMGRQLSGLFHAAGLENVETGLLGGQWQGQPHPDQIASEWAVLAADLAGRLPEADLIELRSLDAAAWQSGERVLFVPTFYALGWKPA